MNLKEFPKRMIEKFKSTMDLIKPTHYSGFFVQDQTGMGKKSSIMGHFLALDSCVFAFLDSFTRVR